MGKKLVYIDVTDQQNNCNMDVGESEVFWRGSCGGLGVVLVLFFLLFLISNNYFSKKI